MAGLFSSYVGRDNNYFNLRVVIFDQIDATSVNNVLIGFPKATVNSFFLLLNEQDVYLHTTCLATLANMAPHAHRLSAYASQRLVSLFYMLSRK